MRSDLVRALFVDNVVRMPIVEQHELQHPRADRPPIFVLLLFRPSTSPRLSPLLEEPVLFSDPLSLHLRFERGDADLSARAFGSAREGRAAGGADPVPGLPVAPVLVPIDREAGDGRRG